MRRVQPFPTQQDTDLAGGPGRVGLAQDPQFVPDRELPPTRTLQPLRHLGVRPTRAVRHNRQILPIDGAVLRHHGPSSFSTLVTNSSFAGVSPTIGREGLADYLSIVARMIFFDMRVHCRDESVSRN